MYLNTGMFVEGSEALILRVKGLWKETFFLFVDI